jgi:O-antigen ligase
MVETNAYAYFLLFCIPLVLCTDRPSKTSLLLAIAAAFAITLSLKRGATIALILSILAYGATYSKCNEKGMTYRKVIPFILIFAIVAVSTVLWQWDEFLLRWADASDVDSIGGGRGIFYRLIIHHWVTGSVVHQLFGFGLFSVAPSLGNMGYFEVYAHSDWLGILHDQGLIGISLFVAVHVALLKLVVRAIRTRHHQGPPLAMGYVIFACANLYSGCTGAPDSMLLFSVLLGYSGAKLMTNR